MHEPVSSLAPFIFVFLHPKPRSILSFRCNLLLFRVWIGTTWFMPLAARAGCASFELYAYLRSAPSHICSYIQTHKSRQQLALHKCFLRGHLCNICSPRDCRYWLWATHKQQICVFEVRLYAVTADAAVVTAAHLWLYQSSVPSLWSFLYVAPPFTESITLK